VLSSTELSDRELGVLEDRWLKNPEALEAKLIRAYLAANQCWHCSADLNHEEHPRCATIAPSGARRATRRIAAMGNTAKARHRRQRRARVESPASPSLQSLAGILRSDARRLRRIGPEARERLRRWWGVSQDEHARFGSERIDAGP
jgi:hypothetical protein